LKEAIEGERQLRALLDRKIGRLESLLDQSCCVAEAALWRHIYAKAHLQLLAGLPSIPYKELEVVLGFIGIILAINIHFVDSYF
jgi:hypothetical protein